MKVLMVRLMKRSGPLDEDGGDDKCAWHKTIAKSIAVLDRLATEQSFPALSSYVSEDPDSVFDAIDDEDEAEALIADLPPVKWFDPGKAMATVRTLIQQLENEPQASGAKNPRALLQELRDLEAKLTFAQSKKAKFRFYSQF